MRPPVRPPRLRCGLFPSIYLPHLLVLPATFGLRCFLPSYPYFPALYVVSVRQVRGLPTASFRFHLTVNTLAVQLCASSLPTRTRDFHPLEPAHGGRTKNERSQLSLRSSYNSIINISDFIHAILKSLIALSSCISRCLLLLPLPVSQVLHKVQC
mgnify:CR=1 FL=1